ncbi:MAG TPA: Ig-like domain-containing protein [Gemmatimonadaceae bacterium]|nr:Ig-like domain-containing protein [Gemmatimonadaceae bacterium]
MAAVSVSLSSASVIAGQTVQATATTRDAGGNTLTGRAVVWTSSNTAAATVGTSGVVTGVAAGTSTITATSEGQSGSATVNVTAVTTPPPPPPGGTSLFAETFEAGSFATWDDGYDPTNHRIVSDASAHGGTRYLEITYPAGNSGGGGWLTKFFGPGRDSVHFSYYVRFPSDWTGGSYLVGLYGSLTSNLWSGFGQAGVCTDGSQFTNHFFFVEGSGSPGAIRFYTYHMDMAQSGGCYGDTGERAGAATYYPPLTMSRGDWHRVELQVRLNTPGQADGWERLYVDGTLVGEWRNMRQRTTSNVKINALQISANTSGGAASATRTINIDDITVSELGATTGTGGGGTTTPAPVATVTVTPNPTSVQAGSTVQLSAATRDASGNTLTGRVVTWSSSNSAVATVSGGGLVTGVAAGSATITATSETRTGTAAVTITAPPPPPAPGTTAFANEPAGLTLLTDNRWDALGTGGWQHADRDSRSQITADATAPASPSNVLEMLYPQGYTGGGEPAIEEYDLGSGQQEVFFGAWVKFSPNWQGHTSGINKIANVMTNAGFGRTWIVLRAVGEQDTNGNLRDGPFFVDVAYCGQYGGYPGANRSLTPFTTGVWHKIEWQVRTGTGGLVRWWVDGVLTGEYTNLNCMGSRLDWVEIAPTFGGTGDTKQQNDYIRYDHVRISGG